MKKIKHFIHMVIRRFFLSRPYSAIFGPFFVLKPRLFGNSKRLTVSNRATVNNAFFNTIGGKIEIEDDVFFGQNVSILTGSHDFTKFGEDRFKAEVTEGNDILIKKGAWVASNSTIIGPCTIGENSVVGACSLVNKDVQPFTIVGGVPAKVIKTIDHP